MRDFLYYSSLGHKAVSPSLYSSILGFRNQLAAINVSKNKNSTFAALKFVEKLFEKNSEQRVLFIELDIETNSLTKHCASVILQPFLVKDWSSGSLTNILSQRQVDVIYLSSLKSNGFILKEANKLDIPVIGLLDSNSDPNLVKLAVLGNDDSDELRCVLVVLVTYSILEGRLISYGLSCL